MQHATLIRVASSLATVGIWVIYLQLFWRGYRRQVRPNVIISRGLGAGVDAHCLIANISAASIFIEGILVRLGSSLGWFTSPVTGVPDGPEGIKPSEGPVAPAGHIDIGTFRGLIKLGTRSMHDHSAPGSGLEENGIDAVEIWVIASYGSENWPVFARRRYTLRSRPRGLRLKPATFRTEIVRSASMQRKVEKELEEVMENSE